MKNLILIVGLQKSGTSLLLRLMKGQPGVASPFGVDGKQYWGDEPPFAPEAFPTGVLFQQHRGVRGHQLDAEDATADVREHLIEKMAELAKGHLAVVAKNTFNTVRLPWLRSIFPDATIVALYRDPHSNVYSLLKKFQAHPERGIPPMQDWWGVKPDGWEKLLRESKVEQCALQWKAVNEELIHHAGLCDRLVSYEAVCREPAKIVKHVLHLCLGAEPELADQWPSLAVVDREYLTGGALRSRNRDYLDGQSLDTQSATADFPPLSEADIAQVTDICERTYEGLCDANSETKNT